MKNNQKGILSAIAAAFLYALSSPLSKLLLESFAPTVLAGTLYVGAGICMTLLLFFRRKDKTKSRFSKKDFPYLLAMVILDILAPVLLLWGLTTTSAAGASLLNNFEIVATAFIAFAFFKERVSPRLWVGIVLVTLSCALLSLEGRESFVLSRGSLLILAATCCWGLENNCTRALSEKDPLVTVMIKGFGSGIGALVIGFVRGEKLPEAQYVLMAILLGTVAYGLSIFFYIYAQRYIGAARTGTFYALCPFFGVGLSLLIFGTVPSGLFWPAFVLMLVGAWFSLEDKPILIRRKEQ